MAKKLVFDLDKLKIVPKKKEKLFNIRIEQDLYEAFNNLCKRKLKQNASHVVREMIRQLCIQNGVLKD
jgi:metal-responsive CopG/Arc/MetJ family transcriptional regulator